MKPIVYVVQAYRYGNRDGHSYISGVYSKKQAAIVAACAEEDNRGGKYDCVIYETELDTSTWAKESKVIKHRSEA